MAVPSASERGHARLPEVVTPLSSVCSSVTRSVTPQAVADGYWNTVAEKSSSDVSSRANLPPVVVLTPTARARSPVPPESRR